MGDSVPYPPYNPSTTAKITVTNSGSLTVQVEGFEDTVIPQYLVKTVLDQDGWGNATAEITDFSCTLKAVEFWEYDGRWNSDGTFNRF